MPIIRAAKSVSYLEYSADSEPWFQLMLVLRRKHSHTRIVQQGLKISRNFTEKCLFIAGNCTFYILNDSFACAEIVWFSLHTIMILVRFYNFFEFEIDEASLNMFVWSFKIMSLLTGCKNIFAIKVSVQTLAEVSETWKYW